MYRYRILCLLLITSSMNGFNRSFFYRTSAFWYEPRFVKPWLSTLDVQLLGGSSHRGRGQGDCPVHLTSLYGPEHISSLSQAAGVPLVLPNDPRCIEFKAVADVFEADFNLYQNFCGGFFAQFHLPMVILRVFPSGFITSGPGCMLPSKQYTPAWDQPLGLLEPFLKRYNLSLARTDGAALSDSTLFFGWSYTYDDTCYLDFIDATIKTGVLFPTGKKAAPREIFSIPYGYNGHWAIPLSGDLSLGIYDWVTFGWHADALFFFKKNECLRMRTAQEATTGLIVLNEGAANFHYGTVWRLGTYAKADHFFNGMSLLLGFTYEQKNSDTVDPQDKNLFNPEHVNNDQRFQAWSRSIVHFLFEYDFVCPGSRAGARLGVFYDHEISGKRVFTINTTGGYLGIDVNWCF